MKVLDLFSGIGGFSLGLERAGFETVAFCEIEEYPRKILKKHWPDIYIHDDVKTLSYIKEGDEPDDWILYDSKINHEIIRGAIDVICGGFPCQDLSISGYQAGIEAERSGLWQEYKRLIREIKPKFALMENVTNLLAGECGMWFGKFLRDLAEIGYDAEWHCIPASYIGACHTRDRVWILAYPVGFLPQRGSEGPVFRQRHLQIKSRRSIKRFSQRSDLPASRFCSGDDGVPNKTPRLKALGNAVVPQIPEAIGRAILEIESS